MAYNRGNFEVKDRVKYMETKCTIIKELSDNEGHICWALDADDPIHSGFSERQYNFLAIAEEMEKID